MYPADENCIATVIEAVTRGTHRSDNTDDDDDADADDPDEDDADDDAADADDNDADDDDADHDADADADDDADDDDAADVGAYHRDAEVRDCRIAHPPAGNAGWVETVVRQVTCTLLTTLLLQQK